MIHHCAAPGCTTLTMGSHCIEHEQLAGAARPPATFARGRRHHRIAAARAVADPRRQIAV
jgi:hypothetical protein